MSKRGNLMRLADNVARYFAGLRAPRNVAWDAGPWHAVAHTVGPDVSDAEVIRAINLVPPHFNINSQQAYDSEAPWLLPDEFIGKTTTTFGASPLSQNRMASYNLQSTAGSGTESRTLQDPSRNGLTLTLTLTVKTTVNLQVMGNTPWWLQTTLNNFTQNGNFGIFSAINQTLQLFSVPCVKSGSTYTAQHNSPATNTTAVRWCAVFSDGATVN